jgi:hypothetical protein
VTEILERLISQIITKGKYSRSEAEKIATARLLKAGLLDAGGDLTHKGQYRERLGAKGRAFSRARKHPASGSFFDPEDNRVKEFSW